jgi:hypothetical protein
MSALKTEKSLFEDHPFLNAAITSPAQTGERSGGLLSVQFLFAIVQLSHRLLRLNPASA